MRIHRPCGRSSVVSFFRDELGYTRPYPSRATYLSLSLELRNAILEFAFPSEELQDEKEHHCSMKHPCAILRPNLSSYRRLSLVNKEWRDEVLRVCDRHAQRHWTSRFQQKTLLGSELEPMYRLLHWNGLVGGRFRLIRELEIDHGRGESFVSSSGVFREHILD
jgi:hypothetical protein